ncbi:MAG: hypothetical protein Q7R66_19995 [Undibacterium sp.]|uniref:hypothetical protein n=1 Tax=Undibacterium sp. TaxID=1914977 RepID=UPI0027211DC0|nr:hypothetical protein [Undibacterium sp.]MDO8654460.1 hypothetical protein [Undibacterium sp.]
MATLKEQRHQTIKNAILRRPEAVVDVSIHLWQRLAVELISIIGADGFDSLFARSAHLNGVAFPWLLLSHSSQQSHARFTGLKISLESRESNEAIVASTALLITFIDILALLIGELLTTRILRSAWGDDTLDIAVKEIQ